MELEFRVGLPLGCFIHGQVSLQTASVFNPLKSSITLFSFVSHITK